MARNTTKGGRTGSATREQVVRHAVELFAAKGYGNTSLDDIAVAVGIRKPSLYHYIDSKEDLLYEVDALLVQELLDEAERLLGEAQTPEDKLRAFFRAGMRLIAKRQAEVTIFLSERHAVDPTAERWAAIAAKRDDYQRMFEGILREGVESGLFRELPTTVAALGMLGTISWAFRWYDPGGAMGADEIADVFADVVLRGILADRA